MTPLKKQHHDFLAKVNESQGILYRICAVYTNDQEDRNDLWQEILLQLWRSFSSFQEKSSVSTWMYRVALNTALMHQRKKKRRWFHRPIEDKELAIAENISAHRDEEVDLLYTCIHDLPHMDRAVILLKLEQKSYREIAEITGFSESNVSIRIVRIKEKLRQMLSEKGVQGE
jgi:RNA polymerase sigma-70 factor (ECF subfamily)